METTTTTIAKQIATEATDEIRIAAKSMDFSDFLAAHGEALRVAVVARAQANVELGSRLLRDGFATPEFEQWAMPRIYVGAKAGTR